VHFGEMTLRNRVILSTMSDYPAIIEKLEGTVSAS
jgi:2,4-dienoyl-CoA reductase-like NADH-dependent reductase (Old Yellow Enzyme family)